MAHAALPSLELTAHGPLHDRVFCVVDAADRTVLRTVRDDVSMACRAVWKPPVLMIETPIGNATGEVVDAGSLTGSYWGRGVELVAVISLGLTGDACQGPIARGLTGDACQGPTARGVTGDACRSPDGPWSPLLSRYFGRPVLLCRVASPGAVVWSGSVSVVTTSSLAEVARRIGRSPDDGARFRPTVVVDTGSAPPFVEDGWVGRQLRLGSAAIRVRGPMARCAVVNRRPGAGGRDADVLAALAPDRVADGEILFGVYGDVVAPARIALGDTVSVEP